MKDAFIVAELVDDLHEKYDQVLGGTDTRSWRELLVYTTAQLTRAGAELGDVLVFLLEYAQLAGDAGATAGRPS